MLKGNLAPDGSVVKRSAVCDEMLVHEGPARILKVMKRQRKQSKQERSIRGM